MEQNRKQGQQEFQSRLTLIRFRELTAAEQEQAFLQLAIERDYFGKRAVCLEAMAERLNAQLEDCKELTAVQKQILEDLRDENNVLRYELKFARDWADGQDIRVSRQEQRSQEAQQCPF